MGALADDVADFHFLHVQAREHLPDGRVVVDAQQGFALQPAHRLGHGLVLREREVHPVALGLPVRGVQVEEGVRPVIP